MLYLVIVGAAVYPYKSESAAYKFAEESGGYVVTLEYADDNGTLVD